MASPKKYFAKIVPVVLLLMILVLPAVAQAVWWNPFSWGFWHKIASIFYKQETTQVQQNKDNNGQENSQEQKAKNDKLLLEDVYPLYKPELKWSHATPKKAEGAEPIDGLETKAEADVSGMAEAGEFFKYYNNKLAGLGWGQDNGFAADGVTGSQVGFKRGEDKIVLSYNLKPGKVISGQNEPLRYTCPCKVTYSIFTTIKKDETADWKTYTNTEYGFEIRYPSDMNLSGGNSNAFGRYFFGLDFQKEKFNFSIKIVKTKDLNYLLAIKEAESNNDENINGQKWEKRIYQTTKENILNYSYFFEKEDKTYIMLAIDYANLAESVNLYNQIVSTFKFIP